MLVNGFLGFVFDYSVMEAEGWVWRKDHILGIGTRIFYGYLTLYVNVQVVSLMCAT